MLMYGIQGEIVVLIVIVMMVTPVQLILVSHIPACILHKLINIKIVGLMLVHVKLGNKVEPAQEVDGVGGAHVVMLDLLQNIVMD